MYIGLGAEAKIYTTTDFSTFTLAKTINSPGEPGWVLSMTEYNGKLYVGLEKNTEEQLLGVLIEDNPKMNFYLLYHFQ